MNQGNLPHSNLINEKNIFDFKQSYEESSPPKILQGSRGRAINNSQLSLASRKG